MIIYNTFDFARSVSYFGIDSGRFCLNPLTLISQQQIILRLSRTNRHPVAKRPFWLLEGACLEAIAGKSTDKEILTMEFRSFRIENFKGIEKMTLDFTRCPKSNVCTLVGLNESGKTTILEAIWLFSFNAEELDPLELFGYGIKNMHRLSQLARVPILRAM